LAAAQRRLLRRICTVLMHLSRSSCLAVRSNIQAATELSSMLRTSFGPNGKNKILINHLSRVFVTSDSATILRECVWGRELCAALAAALSL
jgi:chaperonin GroEL (HSP60 family)